MQQSPFMPQHMTTYSGTTITTELVQKYLDENKQLILAILDNQNLGKLNECAQYQAKLQQNLMYLAAIADAQPLAPSAPMQIKPGPMLQPAQQYMQQHSQLPLGSISIQGQINTVPYMQQPQAPGHPTLQQQQQQQQPAHQLHESDFLQGQPGSIAGSNNVVHLRSNDLSIGTGGISAEKFHDFGQGGASGDSTPTNIGSSGPIAGTLNCPGAGVSLTNAQPTSLDAVNGGDQVTKNAEPSYLKASDNAS